MSKYTEKDISVVVPSYNNLEYLKLLYQSVRTTSKDVELIMYADGCTDGTYEWLSTLPNTDKHVMVFNQEIRMGHTFLYDWGFRKSQRKIIGILHADMVIHTNFFTNILKHMGTDNVVCGTCVEPPLHPPGGEKHIFSAGMYPHEFNTQAFNDFCNLRDADQTRDAIFAPWFILRDEYFERIGGHDSIFAPYGYEDADLFTRMKLKGFRFIQSRDAFVYHFTQRGHKWTKGIGIENDDYKEQMNHTRREYVRKFGTDPLFDENHSPTPAPKYDIGFVVENGNRTILSLLEPYSSTIYIDTQNVDEYIVTEHSAFDMTPRIKPKNDTPQNDIVVTFDANKLAQHNLGVLLQLPLIIQQTNEVGQFEYDIFSITIKQLREVTL